ncbi:MAG TPA: recombinase family protein [Rickettsiales bacterium]|nr:recombinase family protein [Rickettsiales bacterium]
MNEEIKNIELSVEQRDTAALIKNLLGQTMADRYVDVCRLSTGDLELRVSAPIAAQTAKLKEYCQRKNLDILKVFEITESSTVGNRKKFKEMLAFAKETYAKTHKRLAIIVDAVDRLMRNFTEQPVLNDLINQDIIELHFARTGGIVHKDSNSNDRLMWNIQIVMAQNFVDSLKDNVKRSIDYKIKKGEYISQAPIGYLNVPKQQRMKADIILDETRCFLIKRLFQEYATGAYTLGDMTTFAKKWGIRSKNGNILLKSHIHRILQDPFYIGHMTIKGQTYPHNYPHIVDEGTFNKCQQVREAANKKPFKYADKPFLFRGLVKCKDCGCSYSSYAKKGYVYLRPTKSQGICKCIPMREEVVLNQLTSVFKAIRVPELLLTQIGKHLKATHAAKEAYQAQLIDGLRREYDSIKNKLDRLVDLLIEQSITQSIYDTKVQTLKQRQQEIDFQLSGHTKADESFYYTLSALLELTSRAYDALSVRTWIKSVSL